MSLTYAYYKACKVASAHTGDASSSTATHTNNHRSPDDECETLLKPAIWICPHRIYTEAILGDANLDGTYDKECGCPVTVNVGRSELTADYSILRTGRPAANCALFLVLDELLSTLRAAEIPFCPHLKSDDPYLIEDIRRNCPEHHRASNKPTYVLAFPDDERSRELDRYEYVRASCHSCRTHLGIRLEHLQSGHPQILVTLSRRLDDRRGFTSPQEFNYLARNWYHGLESWPFQTEANPVLERIVIK